VIALAQKPTNAKSDSELGSGTGGAAFTTKPSIQKAAAFGELSTTLSKPGPLKLRTPNAMGNIGATTAVAVALPTSDAPLNAVRSKGGVGSSLDSKVMPKAVEKLVCGALKPIVRVRKLPT